MQARGFVGDFEDGGLIGLVLDDIPGAEENADAHIYVVRILPGSPASFTCPDAAGRSLTHVNLVPIPRGDSAAATQERIRRWFGHRVTVTLRDGAGVSQQVLLVKSRPFPLRGEDTLGVNFEVQDPVITGYRFRVRSIVPVLAGRQSAASIVCNGQPVVGCDLIQINRRAVPAALRSVRDLESFVQSMDTLAISLMVQAFDQEEAIEIVLPHDPPGRFDIPALPAEETL